MNTEKKIENSLVTISIKKANQEAPYKLYRKIFKSKKHSNFINSLKDIVRKYYPDYSEDDISNLYSSLSKSGCTYATMANVIMDQLGNDDKTFEDYFGYSLSNSDGTINYDKLMVDIFACISQMVELRISKFERCKFGSVLEAAKAILNKDYTDDSKATLDLFTAGWSGAGVSEDGMLVFVSRQGTNETLIGNYRELAKNMFNIDDLEMNKDKLESLLKANGIEYKFDYLKASSKFSGLPSVKSINLKKWLNKYFEVNGINLMVDTAIIESHDVDYKDFLDNIYSKIDQGYSIETGAPLKGEVWMTDGSEWIKPTEDTAGHQMNFEGFDNDGNILVCSWGKTYMFPKEFYQKLEFMAIKVLPNDKSIKMTR